MFCTKCGIPNPEGSQWCSNCGQPLQPGMMPPVSVPQPLGTAAPPVNNYLVPAILVTIFCCWPLGIPAIVFAAQVNGKLAAGDYSGAVESANKAKSWCWIAAITGLMIGFTWAIFSFFGIFHRWHPY